MEEQIEDFTEQIEDENQVEINQLENEINQLENSLKYPMALKSAIGSGLLGYVLTKRFVPNRDVAILGSLASAYLGYNFTKGRDLTNEQKHSINEEIQARKKRLRS